MKNILFDLSPDLGHSSAVGSSLPILRLSQVGWRGLSDAEAVALLLGDYDTTERAQAILQCATLADAQALYLEQVARLIGPEMAMRFMAALEVGRRAMLPVSYGLAIASPSAAVSYLAPLLMGLKQEHMMVVGLNIRLEPVTYEVVYKGTCEEVGIKAFEMFRPVVARGLNRVMFCHNHPSGYPTPSEADIQVTGALVDIGHKLGIEVVDHLIIGHGTHISIRQNHRSLWSEWRNGQSVAERKETPYICGNGAGVIHFPAEGGM